MFKINKNMKKQLLSLLLTVSVLGLFSCGNSTPQASAQNRVTVSHAQSQQAPQNINVQSNDVPGFDVNQFAQLLKTTANPDALTQAINQPGNSINNLDLDNDGNIDYVRVDQTGDNQLQVIDETGSASSQRVVIATLDINPQTNSYVVTGTPDYCGPTYIYRSPSGLTFNQLLFLSWWMSPSHYHHYYHPYWGYRTHYYRGYNVYHSRYRTAYNPGYMRTRTTTTRTVVRSSPTQVRTAPTQVRSTPTQVRQTATPPQRTSLSSPTQSQRSFSSGQGSQFRNSGANTSGFGGRSSSSSPSRSYSSPSRSSSSSSSRSFGGNSSRSFGGGGRRR